MFQSYTPPCHEQVPLRFFDFESVPSLQVAEYEPLPYELRDELFEPYELRDELFEPYELPNKSLELYELPNKSLEPYELRDELFEPYELPDFGHTCHR